MGILDNEGHSADGLGNAGCCTCYPGEGPLPCPHKHALRDCWRSAVMDETQGHIVRLKNQDRRAEEELLLQYLMRVRCALELETSDFPEVSRRAVT